MSWLNLMAENKVYLMQYENLVDLYKFYWDVALKVNSFFYLVTGSVLVYYAGHRSDLCVKFSVLVPAVLGLILFVVFVAGALWVRSFNEVFENLGEKLEFDYWPDVSIFVLFLSLSSLATGGIGVFNTLVFFNRIQC